MSKASHFLFIIFIAFASACKTTKEITVAKNVEALPYETVAEKFQEQNHQYQTASIKAKVDVTEKKTQSFTANIRMMRDCLFWASLTGALGVEGSRISATKDSKTNNTSNFRIIALIKFRMTNIFGLFCKIGRRNLGGWF
jgi:hypothetical protein